MLNITEILEKAKRYNRSDDFLKAVYGISSAEKFDAIIVAPGWIPEKILAKREKEIEIIADKTGYTSYIVHMDGMRFAWIKCGISSSNVIDAVLAAAESVTEKIIFVGAVGALKADIEIGEFCTPLESYGYDGASLYLREKLDATNFGRTVVPGCMDYIDEVIAKAEKSGIKIEKRRTFCTDSIICEYAHLDEIKATGAELIEMETAAFYECLEIIGKKGIALMCVSDNSASGVPLVQRTPEQRRNFDECRTVSIPEVIKIAANAD